MNEPHETSAGEPPRSTFWDDLNRRMAGPKFRRSYEKQVKRMSQADETSAGEAGGREAMSDERLAEIRQIAADSRAVVARHLTAALRELLAEVERQRGEIARGNEEIALLSAELQTERDAAEDAIVDHVELLAERDAATQRAETAERALAEMRERIGDWEPGRWHQVRQPNGDLWMETSDREEAVTAARETGWALHRLWECHGSEWRAVDDA